MPLKQQLTKYTTASPAIATYNYIDFSEGNGVVVFNGFASSLTASTYEYLLSRESIISALVDGTEASTGVVNAGTLTFAVTFIVPKTIDGSITVEIPMEVGGNAASSIAVDIFHYDGSTQTSIATQLVLPSVDETFFETVTGRMAIDNVHFRKGDTLQIKITATVLSTSVLNIWHDPTGGKSSFADSGGAMKVSVPFLIDT